MPCGKIASASMQDLADAGTERLRELLSFRKTSILRSISPSRTLLQGRSRQTVSVSTFERIVADAVVFPALIRTAISTSVKVGLLKQYDVRSTELISLSQSTRVTATSNAPRARRSRRTGSSV